MIIISRINFFDFVDVVLLLLLDSQQYILHRWLIEISQSFVSLLPHIHYLDWESRFRPKSGLCCPYKTDQLCNPTIYHPRMKRRKMNGNSVYCFPQLWTFASANGNEFSEDIFLFLKFRPDIHPHIIWSKWNGGDSATLTAHPSFYYFMSCMLSTTHRAFRRKLLIYCSFSVFWFATVLNFLRGVDKKYLCI